MKDYNFWAMPFWIYLLWSIFTIKEESTSTTKALFLFWNNQQSATKPWDSSHCVWAYMTSFSWTSMTSMPLSNSSDTSIKHSRECHRLHNSQNSKSAHWKSLVTSLKVWLGLSSSIMSSTTNKPKKLWWELWHHTSDISLILPSSNNRQTTNTRNTSTKTTTKNWNW